MDKPCATSSLRALAKCYLHNFALKGSLQVNVICISSVYVARKLGSAIMDVQQHDVLELCELLLEASISEHVTQA